MFGVEVDYSNMLIQTALHANDSLLGIPVTEAIGKSYVPFKGDTLGLDQVPENTIAERVLRYDQYAALIAEERGEEVNPLAASHGAELVYGARTFVVCDPCDRTSQFQAFLKDNSRKGDKVADVVRRRSTIAQWESKHGKPARITGANTAITCVRRGLPICSVILNYINQQICLACSAGIYQLKIRGKDTDCINLDHFLSKGSPIQFREVSQQHSRRFVTFLGKPERGYPLNLQKSCLVTQDEIPKNLHYDKPGGPTRILYLTNLQPEEQTVGFVVANGEKIVEWIHWLPFIRFAPMQSDWGSRALRIFEISQDESPMRDGYLMMPSPQYSAFNNVSETQVIINVEFLRQLDNPSKYRATFLVVPSTNELIISRANQYGYREVEFAGD